MRERILADIKRLAEANGGQPPGERAFTQNTGIGQSTWRGVYWARWGDAVADAGFERNARTVKVEEQTLLRNLADMFRHLGKVPTAMEFRIAARNNPAFPRQKSSAKYFGSTDAMLRKLSEWTQQNESYSDVAAMLAGRVNESDEPVTKPGVDGFVYLIQWGANYKIGRGDQLERRVKQVRTGLPDSGSLVHAIRTDDPPGIEAYWHRRFAEKRAENGEWFKLSKADVAAFKRRKFQ